MSNSEAVTIRSTVLPRYMKKILLKGTLFAAFGMLSLLVAGILLPIQAMKLWGPIIFIIGLGLVTLGLLPYKRLKRLEENPYTLTIETKVDENGNGKEWLYFATGIKKLFSIPLQSIDHISYIEHEKVYGIGVNFKKPIPEKITVQNQNFDFPGLRKHLTPQYQCDLFLPYFSRRSFVTLQDYMQF